MGPHCHESYLEDAPLAALTCVLVLYGTVMFLLAARFVIRKLSSLYDAIQQPYSGSQISWLEVISRFPVQPPSEIIWVGRFETIIYGLLRTYDKNAFFCQNGKVPENSTIIIHSGVKSDGFPAHLCIKFLHAFEIFRCVGWELKTGIQLRLA